MNAGAALTLYVMSAVTVAAIVLAVVPLPASARRLPEAIGMAGIVATLAITVTQWGERQVAFSGELRIDRFGLLMTWVIMIAALATLLLGWGEPAAAGRRREFTGLVLAAATGMMLTVMSGDLITHLDKEQILGLTLQTFGLMLGIGFQLLGGRAHNLPQWPLVDALPALALLPLIRMVHELL